MDIVDRASLKYFEAVQGLPFLPGRYDLSAGQGKVGRAPEKLARISYINGYEKSLLSLTTAIIDLNDAELLTESFGE